MLRSRYAASPEPRPSRRVEQADHIVPGQGARPDVRVRVRRPRGVPGALPCLFGIHGLGFIAGSREMGDQPAEVWCPRLRCATVSVEQRLAPETRYPGPLEDCHAALQWVHEHAGELGIDRNRIGVTGGGAGGALAAGLCLLARDIGTVPVSLEVLLYPMLDDRDPEEGDHRHRLWTREANAFAWKSYLAEAYKTETIEPYAVPSRAPELSGLPPTYLMVGGLDLLCDQASDYARRLSSAGVLTELHVYPGAPHAFLGLNPDAWVSRRAHRHLLEWLEHQLWPGGLPPD